ncbi:hypothetical protein JCM8115_000149 [Rhodotorula mucilaginosa]|nr:hypothetical protein B0A53_00401 [Rhodotorula sp. CCFEE 5036]
MKARLELPTKVKEKWPTDDEIKALCVIVKAFCEKEGISIRKFSSSLHYESPDARNVSELQGRVELILQLTLFYTGFSSGGRHIFLFILLYAQTFAMLKKPNRTAALGTVCLFKAGDGNNVLEWLGEIAAELGYNDKYYRKMLQAIQDGGPTKGRVGRTQVDRDTRKLLDQAWMQGARNGHVTYTPKVCANGVAQAIADLNHTTCKLRDQSGFYVPLVANEYRAIINEAIRCAKAIKAIKAGEAQNNILACALAAAAPDDSCPFERTQRQMYSMIRGNFCSLVNVLLKNESDPETLFSKCWAGTSSCASIELDPF